MSLHRFLAAGCSAAAAALYIGLTVQAGASPIPAPPLIHENFTLQPCPSKPTTLQIEGCAEHKVITPDKKIDALNTRIFAKLRNAGRRDFINTNADWEKYRELCTAEASIYGGASIEPVAYANCLVAIDGSHETELKVMLLALSPAD
jgi:hypothetical protein